LEVEEPEATATLQGVEAGLVVLVWAHFYHLVLLVKDSTFQLVVEVVEMVKTRPEQQEPTQHLGH
jgi:hypothetical protein